MTGVVSLATVWLTGILLCALLRPEATRKQRIDDLPVAFGLGAGLLHLLFLWISLPGATGIFWFYLLPAGLALGVFCGRGQRGGDAVPVPAPERWQPAEIALFGILCGVLLVTVGLGWVLPLLDWDARILWALKAKILATEQTLTGEIFRDPYRLHIHPRYPLLVPWLGAFMARHQGEFREIHYQVLIALFGILAVWQFYRLARCKATRTEALLLCLILTGTGIWLRSVFDAGVELALVFYLLLTLGVLFRWFAERRLPDLLAAGFFLCYLALTKNEGLLLALSLVAGFTLALVLKKEIAVIPSAVGILVMVFLFASAAWLWHLIQIPPVSDENYLHRLHPEYLRQGSSRLGTIMHAILRETADVRQWHFIWLLLPLLPVLAIMKKKLHTPEFVLPFFLLFTYISGILLIYLLSPWRDIEMHIGVTFDRVMLPMLPVLLLLAARGTSREEVAALEKR